jgi:hypothetical protein
MKNQLRVSKMKRWTRPMSLPEADIDYSPLILNQRKLAPEWERLLFSTGRSSEEFLVFACMEMEERKSKITYL